MNQHRSRRLGRLRDAGDLVHRQIQVERKML
jgi:hypothetical protein